TGAAAGGIAAECTGAAAVQWHPPTGELCRGNEFRHLPDVFSVFRALPALEDARSQRLAVLALCAESLHPCRRAGALCALRAIEYSGARHLPGADAAVQSAGSAQFQSAACRTAPQRLKPAEPCLEFMLFFNWLASP